MCEYDTLDSDIYDETDFKTVRSYYFWILPMMNLSDVLMTLLILTTRCRDDLDFMLIEDVLLVICDFDIC